MKTPNSGFFRSFLHEAQTQEFQLANELLINRLEESITKSAEKRSRKYPSKVVKATAHALENLVLRHPRPSEWTGYLQHEIERKTGASRTLLEDVKSWLHPQPGQPVSTALDDAISHMQLDYELSHITCPLSDADLEKVKNNLYPVTLREFLAHLLGRLTE